MTVRKTIELFSFSAHEGTQAVSAPDFFNVVLTSDRGNRTLIQGNRALVLVGPERREGRIAFRVFEGDTGMPPLIYDTEDESEETLDLPESKMVVNITHVIVDVRLRLLGVEYNHRGAKAKDIETLLVHVYTASKPGSELVGVLTPVADSSFVDAIDRFERIHQASVTVTRPNPGWNDAEEILFELADESNGAQVELSVKETEKQGLSKSKGIVAAIKNMATSAHSVMKSANILGKRSDEPGYSRISLKNFQKKKIVNIPASAERKTVTEAFYDRIEEMIDENQ